MQLSLSGTHFNNLSLHGAGPGGFPKEKKKEEEKEGEKEEEEEEEEEVEWRYAGPRNNVVSGGFQCDLLRALLEEESVP